MNDKLKFQSPKNFQQLRRPSEAFAFADELVKKDLEFAANILHKGTGHKTATHKTAAKVTESVSPVDMIVAE